MDLVSMKENRGDIDKEWNHFNCNFFNWNLKRIPELYTVLHTLPTFGAIHNSHNKMLIHCPSIGLVVGSFCSLTRVHDLSSNLFKFGVPQDDNVARMPHCNKRPHHSILKKSKSQVYLDL